MIFGGHGLVSDCVIDFAPWFDRQSGEKIGRDLIDAQSAFGARGTVAFQAVLGKERLDR